MNTLKNLSLSFTLGLVAITASAHDGNHPATRVVNFVALEASSPDGAESIYRRLKAAAREVCASASGTMLSERYQYRTCVDTALANAVELVNQPLVSSAHAAGTKGRTVRVASR
jgi:UrcA family protein